MKKKQKSGPDPIIDPKLIELMFYLGSQEESFDDEAFRFNTHAPTSEERYVYFLTLFFQYPESGGSKLFLQKAEFWKAVHDWDENQKREFFIKFAGDENLQVARVRAQKDPEAVDCLKLKAARIVGGLVQLTEMGNQAAARALVDFVIKSVAALNQLAENPSEVLKIAAGSETIWPVNKSPHPHFDTNEKELFKKVELSKTHPFIIDAAARWNPNGEITMVAKRLYNALAHYREIAPKFGNEVPAYCPSIQSIGKLQPFSRESALHWWEFAKELILIDTPEPEKIPEYDKWVTAKSHRKYPSKIRARIFFKLRSAFISLAGR